MPESGRIKQKKVADLIDELQGIRYHLQEALQKANAVGNVMVEDLVREALEEVQTALDQVL